MCPLLAGEIGIELLLSSLPPQPAQRFVYGNTRKPGCERGFPAKAADSRKGPQIGFLQDFFCVSIIAHDGARQPVKPLIIASDDSADRFWLARLRCANKRTLALLRFGTRPAFQFL